MGFSSSTNLALECAALVEALQASLFRSVRRSTFATGKASWEMLVEATRCVKVVCVDDVYQDDPQVTTELCDEASDCENAACGFEIFDQASTRIFNLLPKR